MEEISDRDFKMINRGIEIGAKHTEPSPKTIEAINNIQNICATRGTEIALMQQSVEDIKTDVKDIREKDIKEIKSMIIGLESKFSAKWVETVFLWAFRIIGSLLLVGSFGLMGKIIVDFLTRS